MVGIFKQLSPAARISLSLVLFTLSVLLIADSFGLIPDHRENVIEARKKVCESLAVQLSVAISSAQDKIAKRTLDSFVARNDDVLAAVMVRSRDGVVIMETGEYTETPDPTADE